ncbi:exodeoxyribonuclease VII small subunit [Paenibacillus arenosi]|uniref:Exodeoxyribonuclease 7 small subunit n=1 Tax=Paenibacillus arenosi TaxID=2774142 RepID=A0ABR9AUC5_9BACL|nr:exodeoxyribonuclease VII small subunit [Paenibacillus arenosi]MBD8497728.1 exodeoxyribonuclease VII small subunit [Paenibacillus arenosi]
MSNIEEQHQALSFEAAMERLEQIVNQLESGDVPLEQAIDLFQEGMHLSKACSSKLEQVERRIEVLTEQHGEWDKQPFQAEAGEGSE